MAPGNKLQLFYDFCLTPLASLSSPRKVLMVSEFVRSRGLNFYFRANYSSPQIRKDRICSCIGDKHGDRLTFPFAKYFHPHFPRKGHASTGQQFSNEVYFEWSSHWSRAEKSCGSGKRSDNVIIVTVNHYWSLWNWSLNRSIRSISRVMLIAERRGKRFSKQVRRSGDQWASKCCWQLPLLIAPCLMANILSLFAPPREQ